MRVAMIEQKAAKGAKKRGLCDLRDLLLRILEQRGIANSIPTMLRSNAP